VKQAKGLRWIVFLLALAQLAAPPLLFAAGESSVLFAARSPIVPAGYAFSIWGFIYLAAVVWSGWHLFARDRDSALYPRIAVPLALTFVLCILWLAAARFGPTAATVPIFAAMLLLLLRALAVIGGPAGAQAPRTSRFLSLALVGPYAGWSSVALFANFTEVQLDLGWNYLGLQPEVWTAAALATATLLVLVVVRFGRGTLWYSGAVLWALAGITAANLGEGPWLVLGALVLSATLLLLVTWRERTRRPAAVTST
jgi:hypothetical protein